MQDDNQILSELGSNAVESETLSRLLQAAYQGRYDWNELAQALNRFKDSLSNPLAHKPPDVQTEQQIKNAQNNYVLPGIYQPISLSDDDLGLIRIFSQYTQLNQKYVVGFLRDAKLQNEIERQKNQQGSNNQNQNQQQNYRKIQEFIKNAYFTSRKLRLKVLRELIVVYDHISQNQSNQQFDQNQNELVPLQKLIASVVQYLFEKNFISNICKSIQNILNLFPTSSSNSNSIRRKKTQFLSEYQSEICECLAIFYATSQRIMFNVSDITSLLTLFDRIVKNEEFIRSPRLKSCSYILSITLYQILDSSNSSLYINPRNNSEFQQNKIINDSILNTSLNTHKNKLMSLITNNKINPLTRYASSFLLLIISIAYKIQEKIRQSNLYGKKDCALALKGNALEGFYNDFLLNPSLRQEFSEMKFSLYVSMGDIITELFELCDHEIRAYFDREKKSLSQYKKFANQYQQQLQYKERPIGLTIMLNILIHLAHHSDGFCNTLLSNDSAKTFIEFLDNIADLPTPWFPQYATFIYELSKSNTYEVYNKIISDKCEKLTVDAIWQILEKTSQIYVPKKVSSNQYNNNNNNNFSDNPYEQQTISNMININNQNQNQIIDIQPPQMNDQEISIICSVLKVLQSLGSINEIQDMLNYNSRPPGIIALLFKLLQCYIPTQVTAHVISCLTSFINNSVEQCYKVWTYLEQNQILYTQRQPNKPITQGVELDIIEGEKDGADAIYPVTVAFCELLCKLLETADIPQLLGKGTRQTKPPGIYPYTQYVREMVFLRWSKREYKSKREEWELAATCLQIFELLLKKFKPTDLQPNTNVRYLFTKHVSFEFMTLLLAPHSNLIEVILDIFQKAWNIVDSDLIFDDDTMKYINLSLKHSLNLIQLAIKSEDKFLNICQKYWPQKLSLRPLNTTLLSQQYRIQVISLAKCIEYGNDPVVSSHALSILHHLNKTHQGITLRSVFNEQLTILQSAFSSQLSNPPQQTQDNDIKDDINDNEDILPDIRVSIVEFLLNALSISGHNLGLMLLAFSEQSASRDNLTSPISCLNALLNLSIQQEFSFHSAPLAESTFELLFKLLSNSRIGERFLNAAENICRSFFITLLRQNITSTSNKNGNNFDETTMTSYLNQRAWLLRAVSFEFHLAAKFKKTGIIDAEDIKYLGFITDNDCDDNDFAVWQIFDQFDINISHDFRIDKIPQIWGLNMDQFKIYNNQQNSGTYLWNIEKLYLSLQRRQAQSQQLQQKTNELNEYVQTALNHNTTISLINGLDHAYDSWAELIKCVLGNKIIAYSNINNQLLLKLLDGILRRLSTIVHGPFWSRISNTISQVALTIMYFFRHSLNDNSPVQIAIVGCRTILEGMVNSILMQTDVRNTRANLYSCLSNYLHYCKFKTPNILSDVDESKAIDLNEKVQTEKDTLNLNNVSTLLARRDELLSIIFSDCVSSDAYLSSISCLILQDLLSSHSNVSLDEYNKTAPQIWLKMMLTKSRLLFILKHSCDLDSHIQRALASQRHWYFLYQFESMIDVLIASSIYKNGSMELIDNNCITQYLSQLKCLTSRVFWTAYSSKSLSNNNNTNYNILNAGNDKETNLSMECSRYLQLLTPCLRLINSMFTSCPKNVRLHYQTLTFFQKHNDIINKLLTLDNNEFVVLRCVKLILSIWYQLYCGPLYIRDNNRITTISARDTTIMEHIESKEQIFYFLIKKFKSIAFKNDNNNNNNDFNMAGDNDFNDIMNATAMFNERAYTQTNGELPETISREIMRILINIFRLKSIGSSNITSIDQIAFKPIFEKDFDVNSKINDDPPNLRLLCDCLLGILPISKQIGKWIYDTNNELSRIQTNNLETMIARLQKIESMLPMISSDVNLHCFLIENMLLLLYFHCAEYLKTFENDFYNKFRNVIISEVISALKDWYQDENSCILHVDQNMIEQRWSNGIHISKSCKVFIEVMIQKFINLDRDNRIVPSIDYN